MPEVMTCDFSPAVSAAEASMLQINRRPPRVFLVCSGLGHLRRGFESFTQECFDALSSEPGLDMTLFSGGGQSKGRQVALWTLKRRNAITQWMGACTGRGVYFIEQATFFLSLIPYLHLRKPDVVYFSDGNLGNMLWHWRRLTGASYRLLFSNGGPILPPYARCDHVQQVNPHHLQEAFGAGEIPERNSLVPYGFEIDREHVSLTPSEKSALRTKLGLPTDRQVILSVGAINTSHKRMDYLVREMAKLAEPRPYLLLLGQIENESDEIKTLADQLIGCANYSIRTVGTEEMASYYQAADIFVLTSISEAFGRVLAEAGAHGLPCVAHDYEVARYVVGDEGYFCDMRKEGELADVMSKVIKQEDHDEDVQRRHNAIYDKFSWNVLRPRYVELIERCLGTPAVRA